jgi:hypothetical protein
MSLRAVRLAVMLVSRQQEASARSSQQYAHHVAALLKFPSSPVRIALFTAASASRK